MGINLSGLSNLTLAAGSLSGLILVNPQKNIGYQSQVLPDKNGNLPATPPKFLFDYEGENVFNLQSDITDHFVEDNTTISDQIALPPEQIMVSGFIGELNDVTPEILEEIQFGVEKLLILSPYTPDLTATALVAFNAAKQAYAAAESVKNSSVALWDSISGGTNENQTKQQKAFQQFYGYWKDKALFTVQTPWAVMTDMAIASLKATQGPESEEVTNFEISFKKMRFASSLVTDTSIEKHLKTGRAAEASGTEVDKGQSVPIESISLGSALPNFGGVA